MTSWKPKIKFIVFLMIAGLLLVPGSSQAAGLVPCGGSGEQPCNVYHVFYIIARVTNWLIMVAGLYAVFQIVTAGFWLVVSMGNEEAITKNKKMLTSALVGFVMVMMAFIFVNTAVNMILASKCKVNLRDPMSYIKINVDPNACVKQPIR